VGKPEEMRQLVSLGFTREDTFKKDLKEIRWEGWIGFIWLGIWTVRGLLITG